MNEGGYGRGTRAWYALAAASALVLTPACASIAGLGDLPVPADASADGTQGSSGGSADGALDGTLSGDASSDALASETGADGSNDSGDAAVDLCKPTGTGALGTLGCACSTPGELACNGNAQKVALVCSGGSWTLLQVCGAGENCESTSGPNQGLCAPIDPLCASATSGSVVCGSPSTTVTCGPDLVNHVAAATCTGQVCVDGVC